MLTDGRRQLPSADRLARQPVEHRPHLFSRDPATRSIAQTTGRHRQPSSPGVLAGVALLGAEHAELAVAGRKAGLVTQPLADGQRPPVVLLGRPILPPLLSDHAELAVGVGGVLGVGVDPAEDLGV